MLNKKSLYNKENNQQNEDITCRMGEKYLQTKSLASN